MAMEFVVCGSVGTSLIHNGTAYGAGQRVTFADDEGEIAAGLVRGGTIEPVEVWEARERAEAAKEEAIEKAEQAVRDARKGIAAGKPEATNAITGPVETSVPMNLGTTETNAGAGDEEPKGKKRR